jgi:hypothetical protein
MTDDLKTQRKLRSHGDPGNVKCALSLDVSLIVPGKLADIDALGDILQEQVDQLIARCKEAGYESYLRVGVVGIVPHEVLVSIIPRRVHYGENGRQICTTEHVSPKNITTDGSKVTCRLCRKLKGYEG